MNMEMFCTLTCGYDPCDPPSPGYDATEEDETEEESVSDLLSIISLFIPPRENASLSTKVAIV